MYYVCMKNDGRFVCYVDFRGFTLTADVDDAISTDSEMGCMALIMFLACFTDNDFEDFYIQFYPEV